MISNPVNIITRSKGAQPASIPSVTIKVAKTFSIVWPAIIFANSLKLRLIGLTKYEMISIGISMGKRANGTPDGIKKVKNLRMGRPIIQKHSYIKNKHASLTRHLHR